MTGSDVFVDRSIQLDIYRQERLMTDIELVCGNVILPAHKLILSLHSAYFSTLFQSQGFIESDKSRVEMTGFLSHILSDVITYIYTGRLKMDRNNVLDLLEIMEMLQIDDKSLIGKATNLLVNCARDCNELEELFTLWNTAVLYDMSDLLEAVMTAMEMRIEQFCSNPSDLLWLDRLGWEEMSQLLARPGICVKSEAVLLDFLVDWGRDKVTTLEDFAQLMELVTQVRFTRLDKLYVQNIISSNFSNSLVESIKPKKPASSYPRLCHHCVYLTQFKLAKTQLRNIEDFVDRGEKSLFFCLSLKEEKLASRVNSLSSMNSMVTTANGNYGRPITRGSRMFQVGQLMVVVGGESQTDKHRTDLLIYSSVKQAWITSSKVQLRVRPNCKLHDMIQVGDYLYLVWIASHPTNITDPVHRGAVRALLGGDEAFNVLERLDLNSAVERRVEREVVGQLPAHLEGEIALATIKHDIYFVKEGLMWKFNVDQLKWTELAVPLGSLGKGQPLLTSCPPNLHLVGGRPDNGDDNHTNSWQIYDPNKGPLGSWRRPEVGITRRLTPVDIFTHCGLVYLVGWQTAHHNMIMELDPVSEEVNVVTEGHEGVWSRGVLLKGELGSGLMK